MISWRNDSGWLMTLSMRNNVIKFAPHLRKNRILPNPLTRALNMYAKFIDNQVNHRPGSQYKTRIIGDFPLQCDKSSHSLSWKFDNCHNKIKEGGFEITEGKQNFSIQIKSKHIYDVFISGYRVSTRQRSESLSVSVQGSAGAPHQKWRIQIVQHNTGAFTCSKRVGEAPHGTYDLG